MSYRFSKGAGLSEQVRRVAIEEIESAIDEITRREPDVYEAVHEARKHFKKTRSLIRLVRDSSPRYFRTQNHVLRDLGRNLSSTRDAQAMLECWESLRLRYRRAFGKGRLDRFRHQLIDHRDEIAANETALNETIEKVVSTLQDARDRVEDWSFEREDFGLIQGGFTRCYRRGRQSMKSAVQAKSGEAFHSWRKRVKDHWYHIRLLEEAWPGPMQARNQEMATLSDLLGDYHDLVVFEEWLAGPRGSDALRRELTAIVARRRATLSVKSFDLGGRIYAELSRAFATRIRNGWESEG